MQLSYQKLKSQAGREANQGKMGCVNALRASKSLITSRFISRLNQKQNHK